MASIRPIGVTSITAGSGVYVSSNVGAVTIAVTGSSSAAAVGLSSQVIYNSSGTLVGSSGFLFDGNQTFLCGNDQGHQQFTTFPGAIFSTRPSTFGGSASFLESPFLFYDGYVTGHATNSSYQGVLIGGTANSLGSPNFSAMISLNGLLERRFAGITYAPGPDNFYRLLIGNNGAGGGNAAAGIGFTVDGQWTNNLYISSNSNFIIGNAITDNTNGKIQIVSSTGVAGGIVFGNDNPQCSIYRSNTGVLTSPASSWIFGGTLTTVAPSGGSASAFTIGSLVTGVSVVVDTTRYIQASFGGVPVKLLIAQ